MFKSILGYVSKLDFITSILLMLKGMLGIFIVMFLIYLVIIFLGKTFYKDEKTITKPKV